ncbi:helix-turn-helix transcriptional regulator [Bradyrhizobium sp. USDA 3458]|uniref:helix-turn-helix domain-containing protein n=1 Tax=Bradyrhizobium sp. USDA 3458 TaxID=2591461 RepID=UPI001142A57F|nr:helix-turn-helix transcriptional regulator [Bradyrhizobium sp. USDA 3458]
MALGNLGEQPFHLLRLPAEPSADGLRTWVQQICSYLEITPTELARAASIAPSTLNRFVGDASGDRGLTAKTLRSLLEAATKIHNDKFGAAVAHGPRGVNDFNNYSIVHVRVAASLSEDSFHSDHLWPIEYQFFTSIVVPSDAALNSLDNASLRRAVLQGFVIIDHHADRAFRKSTILICAPYTEADYLIPGRYYVVSRSNEQGKKELTVRYFMVSPSADMWLIAQSTAKDSKPDVHLGRAVEDFGTERMLQAYRPTKSSEYEVAFTVVCAVTPQIDAYEDLFFPA